MKIVWKSGRNFHPVECGANTEIKHIERPLRIQPIKSLWRERLLKDHEVDKFDKVAQNQLIERLTDEGTLPSVGPTTIEAPSMDDVLVFDLESWDLRDLCRRLADLDRIRAVDC